LYPTIRRDIDSKMLTKRDPMKGDTIIMTDKAIEIASSTIQDIPSKSRLYNLDLLQHVFPKVLH